MSRAPAPAEEVLARLERAYGKRPWKTSGKPIEVLIQTVLSQNTNDTNSGRAMERIREAFPGLDAVADARLATIAAAIRPAGLHRQKARNIRSILRAIRAERGEVTLAHLKRWTTDRAHAYLKGLPGVGPKTAACVLLFSLKRPVLPVDTHVHRVSRRLGLLGAKTSAAAAHQALAGCVPDAKVYAFHVLLIAHGRRTCHARRPACGECALALLCPSAFTVD